MEVIKFEYKVNNKCLWVKMEQKAWLREESRDFGDSQGEKSKNIKEKRENVIIYI